METDWSDLHEPHERLRWARIRAGYPTARAAAESLGMKEGTYSAFEREPGSSRSRMLDHQSAMRFGRKYKVAWEWLLTGKKSPLTGAVTEAQEQVLSTMAEVSEAKQKEIAAVVAAMAATGTDG